MGVGELARVEHVFGHRENSMGRKIVRTIGDVAASALSAVTLAARVILAGKVWCAVAATSLVIASAKLSVKLAAEASLAARVLAAPQPRPVRCPARVGGHILLGRQLCGLNKVLRTTAPSKLKRRSAIGPVASAGG
jgi:hypothetical protein